MHSYVHAYVYLWALSFFDEICIYNAFNDDMMCLLPIFFLWFDDTCVALFEMICFAMIRWMLGWCDEVF